MDSPPQTVTVRGGDFFVLGKRAEIYVDMELWGKTIGFGRARLVLENGVQMI